VAELYVPAGQFEQAEMLVSPVPVLYVPVMHIEHTETPEAER